MPNLLSYRRISPVGFARTHDNQIGIDRVEGTGKDAAGRLKAKLVGDVAIGEAIQRAGAITPVPDGVGPMTIAMDAEYAPRGAIEDRAKANFLTAAPR